MTRVAREIERRLRLGITNKDDAIERTCKFVATLLVGYSQSMILTAIIYEPEGALRLPIERVHANWHKSVVLNAMANSKMAEMIEEMKTPFYKPFVVPLMDFKDINLLLMDAEIPSFNCAACNLPYHSKTNAARCEASHRKQGCSLRRGVYSKDELASFWDSLDATTRLAILDERMVPPPKDPMTITSNVLFEQVEEASEFTHLFCITSPPAKFEQVPKPKDLRQMNDYLTERAAVAADRLMHSLVGSLRASKERIVLDALQLDEEAFRKKEEAKAKKKHSAKMKRLEKTLFTRNIVVGLHGNWWEEDY